MFIAAIVPRAPRRGTIRLVRATAEVAEDPDATVGNYTTANDLSVQVMEGPSASGLGGSSRQSVPLRYALSAEDPLLTFASEEDVDYFVPAGEELHVAALLAGGQAPESPTGIVVVTLVIQPLSGS